MIKGHDANIPQEAIIGISYAVASAAVILTMSKSTGEAEHLRDMLVGNILSVQWPEVWLDGRDLRGDRRLPLRVPPAVPRDLGRRRKGAAARGVPVRCGTFCSTPRSGWSSPARSPSPACCSSSAISSCRRSARCCWRTAHRIAARDRLDHGRAGVDARDVLLGASSICRPARRSSARSGWSWRSWRWSGSWEAGRSSSRSGLRVGTDCFAHQPASLLDFAVAAASRNITMTIRLRVPASG